MSTELRRQLIETAIQLNRSGINSGTSGNVSMRHEDGMLITPSGRSYEDLQTSDIVFVTLDGTWDAVKKPSSEWRFHRDIYRQRPETNAVVHAHPVFCTALACLGKPIPAFHYMVTVAGGENIRCAPYATFGSQELSNHVIEALDGRLACLMANHGLTCIEKSLSRALALAIEVENLARTYTQCLAMGDPVLLDSEEMLRVIEKFQHYGSNQ